MASLPYTLPTTLPGGRALAPPSRVPGSLVPALRAREEMRDLILTQYLDSSILLSLLGAYMDRCTALDDVIVRVYEDSFDVERADGVWLRRLASLVGEPIGVDTASLRRRVRVRMLINRSSGTVYDVAGVARAASEMGSGGQVRVRPEGPAQIAVRVDGPNPGPSRDTHDMITQSVAAGVRLTTITIPREHARGFRLSRYYEAESKSLDGLSDVSQLWGAPLAHAIV